MRKILFNEHGQIRTTIILFALWVFCTAVTIGAFWLDRNY